MALVWPIIDFILDESSRNPIAGDVLFVGKQETFGGREMKHTDAIRMHTMDWSPHFGADIVCDLGYPIPDELENRFDFIYDGGSLDNMFNPAQGIMNIARMLRPNGRMLCLACASSYSLPYTMFSPGWFHDYFEFNKFLHWEVNVCKYKDEHDLIYGPWVKYVYDYEEGIKTGGMNRPAPACNTKEDNWLLVSIAQKGQESTWDVQPIQYQYRKDSPQQLAASSPPEAAL